jgi:hypothetical protein
VREFNDPPLFGSSHWHDKLFEIRRPRDYARKRRWRVENTRTREAYDIVRARRTAVATAHPDAPFGRGDLWLVRYHGAEVDDGSVAVVATVRGGHRQVDQTAKRSATTT